MCIYFSVLLAPELNTLNMLTCCAVLEGNEFKIPQMESFINDCLDHFPAYCSYDRSTPCRCLLAHQSFKGVRMDWEEKVLSDLVIRLKGPIFNKYRFIFWEVLIEHSRTRFSKESAGIYGKGETLEEAAKNAKDRFDIFSSRGLRSRRETWITGLCVRACVDDPQGQDRVGTEFWWRYFSFAPHWIWSWSPTECACNLSQELGFEDTDDAKYMLMIELAKKSFLLALERSHKKQAEEVLNCAIKWFNARAQIKLDAMKVKEKKQ